MAILSLYHIVGLRLRVNEKKVVAQFFDCYRHHDPICVGSFPDSASRLQHCEVQSRTSSDHVEVII